MFLSSCIVWPTISIINDVLWACVVLAHCPCAHACMSQDILHHMLNMLLSITNQSQKFGTTIALPHICGLLYCRSVCHQFIAAYANFLTSPPPNSPSPFAMLEPYWYSLDSIALKACKSINMNILIVIVIWNNTK